MMILVEVIVPSINKKLNFRLDENAYIADVAAEIGEILVVRASEKNTSIIDDLMLCDCERNVVLRLNHTLKQSGIGNGSKLMIL